LEELEEELEESERGSREKHNEEHCFLTEEGEDSASYLFTIIYRCSLTLSPTY
jgi:hypothetical protein